MSFPLRVSRVDWRAEAAEAKRVASEWQELATRASEQMAALDAELGAERERREKAERELVEQRTLLQDLRHVCEMVVDATRQGEDVPPEPAAIADSSSARQTFQQS